VRHTGIIPFRFGFGGTPQEKNVISSLSRVVFISYNVFKPGLWDPKILFFQADFCLIASNTDIVPGYMPRFLFPDMTGKPVLLI